MSSNEKPRCPRCGGKPIRIAYGYPSFDMFEAAERGDIQLGGCVVSDGQPTLHCRQCDADFGGRPSE